MKSELKKRLSNFPKAKHNIKKALNAIKGNEIENYPKASGKETTQFQDVLYSNAWNLSYSTEGKHTELEKYFKNYINTEYAVAVNTGGMALQMICRALGLKHGDEIIHQVDTCVATSFALMNAGVTPIFSDINTENFLLDEKSLQENIGKNTKAIMPIHLWGNPENMEMIQAIASKNNLLVIEDSCLSLGSEYKGKKTGSFGIASAFSFGCLKPVQAGEGGMITTNDKDLYKELLILRNWGETTSVLGYRDNLQLAWNGRISEFVAAVALEQLKSYPSHLNLLQDNVNYFYEYIKNKSGIEIINKHEYIKQTHTAIVLKIDKSKLRLNKQELISKLSTKDIFCWHANFEPINTLSFFKNETWRHWIIKGDIDKVHRNYNAEYLTSNLVYNDIGISISKQHFLNKKKTIALISILEKILV